MSFLNILGRRGRGRPKCFNDFGRWRRLVEPKTEWFYIRGTNVCFKRPFMCVVNLVSLRKKLVGPQIRLQSELDYPCIAMDHTGTWTALGESASSQRIIQFDWCERILHNKHAHPHSDEWEEWAKSKLGQNPWILTKHDVVQANKLKSGGKTPVRRKKALATPLPPDHYLTHTPKHPDCEICQQAKPQNKSHRKQKKGDWSRRPRR